MDEKKTLKEWAKEKSEAAKLKMHRFAIFCQENKEAVAIMAPIVIGSGIEMIKILTRHNTASEEKRLKDNYVYDRINGHYYELRRKPKSREWVQIDERKNNGESLGYILQDMRLLK